jgi:hypothetical protein
MYLYEGGNVFDNTEPVAKEDVPTVVGTVTRELPSALKAIPDIGSAGYKVESGDIDLFLDERATLKNFSADDVLAGKKALQQYFIAKGYDAKIKGLLAWLPSSSPASGDNFFSVDRSNDASRLAGIRFDGSPMPIEEALISAASRLAREGGKPDYCFMSYSKYADLEKALGSKVQYIDMKVNPEIAFRGVVINGPRGPIKVVPDQNCPNDRAFMLQMNTWKLYSYSTPL